MQTAYTFFDAQISEQKLIQKENFRLTARDLDIIEFVLEMKFSTIEDIHSKFFKYTKQGEKSLCLRWARERVANLVKANFLKVVKDVCHRTLYIATNKGYLFLKNSRFGRLFSRPLADIDGRTYDHDQKVIQIRTTLEETGKVASWISERQLSEFDEYRKFLPTEFRPDAIYTNAEGKKVAFELEIARKSKDRYQQKIKRYIQLMLENGEQPIFELVHFVCEKETVLELIKDQTELFQSCFQFNLLSEIIEQKES